MSSRFAAMVLKASSGPASRPARSWALNSGEGFIIRFIIGFVLLFSIFVGALMPQQFLGQCKINRIGRRVGIPTFGDGKLIRAGPNLKNDSPFSRLVWVPVWPSLFAAQIGKA